MNNFEKIKSMSVDEMAEFIKCGDCYYCPARWCEDDELNDESCTKKLKQWLESEVE